MIETLKAVKGAAEIDPPYNAGHDFVYRDKFDEESEIFNRFLLGPIPHERGDEK